MTTLGPRGEGLIFVTAHFMEKLKMRGNHWGSFRLIPDVSFIGKYKFGRGAILILLLSYCNPPYSGECVHSPPFPKTKSFVIPSELRDIASFALGTISYEEILARGHFN